MTTWLLDKLVESEQAIRIQAESLRVQIEKLAGQVVGLEAVLDDLAAVRKGLLGREGDETGGDGPAIPAENPVYRHILTGLAAARAPVRAKDLCRTLDLGAEPNEVEGMRSLLERLVARGVIIQAEPELFALRRQ